ncbi:retrotransposon gag protein, partial [Rhizoctonia solani AG-3 Rhs1AP]
MSVPSTQALPGPSTIPQPATAPPPQQVLRPVVPAPPTIVPPPVIAAPAPRLPAGVKLAKPPMYNGKDKEKLEEFEMKCAMYLDSLAPGMDEKLKINFVTGYLEDKAQRWLTAWLLQEGRNPGSVPFLNSWPLFWAELNHRFGEHNKEEKYRIALNKLKQTRDVQNYLYEFQRLAQPLHYSDNELHDRFYDGLRSEIHQMMMTTRFKPREHTRDEVFNEALRIWEDLEAYKALHGSSTGNTTTTKTTTTTSATPSGKTTTTTERVRFNAGDAVYRLKDGKAQKGVIQSIGQVGKWTTPLVKWNNMDKPENARFNELKKDNHPVTTTVVKSTAKGPGPMELDGKGMSGITCFKCRGKGHTADVCPSKIYQATKLK